jgi:hypothetical protein
VTHFDSSAPSIYLKLTKITAEKIIPIAMPHSIQPEIPNALRTCLSTLLLADTDGPSSSAGGLGVLTAHAETPVVTETTVGTDLLEALEILTELGVHAVGEDLAVLAVDDVTLSV